MCDNTFIGGTENGNLIYCDFPFVKEPEIKEIQIHEKAIVSIKVSQNRDFVITVGEDGSIFIHKTPLSISSNSQKNTVKEQFF